MGSRRKETFVFLFLFLINIFIYIYIFNKFSHEHRTILKSDYFKIALRATITMGDSDFKS